MIHHNHGRSLRVQSYMWATIISLMETVEREIQTPTKTNAWSPQGHGGHNEMDNKRKQNFSLQHILQSAKKSHTIVIE